ncbi:MULTISPECIES: nitrate reductase [unclassified Novosphingobium]|uniref:nitrate reductase n=1 Tax=unclassified Novosphingobium TaxID=2644732 RepID=UPI00086E6FB2|nr:MULTISPECIES: molybdopterin-dependent oxidoreductase [unclassified Novosphingobium]MBN9146242.1 molybdopterin-dependent oxidoreductase [Novosphingobium sp.]MDR6707118.1 assimilatory nitrate reductase catalytic subunit [Novosphingobium sp. 1748]ODU79311.1 MAG: nitrate reductase [Novosphingobium sp. SCN 63-17]OJX93046.1 MAG: nitrate reductase [Novosphingobium sp. 63-713]
MNKAAIRTTCAYCGVGCGIAAQVAAAPRQAGVPGERAVTIQGDGQHPANHGRLCSKGTHLGETVALEGRLLAPMIGDQTVGWDGALDEVADRMRETIEAHGPDAVAFYVSGQLLTEDYYVANKLMKGFIGSANIDTNSRLCMASAVAAHNRAFGEDIVPGSYSDLEEADLILLVGSNTAWCHPVIWQRMEAARAARGTKIVVIDPRRTETAEQADLHVALAPDGDVALFNALLAEMHKRGLTDDAALNVPLGFWAGLPCDPCVPAEQFAALADLVAAHPRMVTLFSMGANQSSSGTDKGNAITNLHLAMGRINQPGAAPFSMTGQPNAMGGREVGGLANMLACHLGFSDAELRDVAGFWNTANICSGPGKKAVDMFRAIHDGSIKFLWVMATNPAASMPDAGFVREALARCPTVVVSEAIADTDTGRFAHIRLPAHAWGEKDGTVTNSERRISRQRTLFPAPGEAKADWWIMGQVAARMGWGDAFAYDRPAQIWREYAAMTELAVRYGRRLDLRDHAAISDADYDAMMPFQWGGDYPLADGYSTPDGRAWLISVRPPAMAAIDPAYPLRLNTGRYRDQWHTMTRTGYAPTLAQHRREALLEIHPDDAMLYGLDDGGLARVATANGASVFRIGVSDGQRRGDIFVPMHWTDVMAGGARANLLPAQRVDPVSGQPAFKNTPARVEPVAPEWRGFLLLKEPAAPEGLLFWSRSRVKDGWLYELAGMGSVEVDALLPAGERLEVADHVRGMRRIAVRGDDAALAGALFVTREGTLPARAWIAEQLGADGEATEWLAARPSTPAPDRGAIVCVCHGVGEKDIEEAICAGACSVAAIGEETRAGTNCGSCRPALARMLAKMMEAAE